MIYDKPLRVGEHLLIMYKFYSGKRNNVQECCCSIEPKTRLLVVEQKMEGEEWSRYIRLTGQQGQRIKELFFKGSFYSATRPSNYFTLEDGVITMCCRAENQVIKLSVGDMSQVYQYYERHKDRIARFDVEFRKR